MGGGQSVLLVEDEPAQRLLLAAYLSGAGFRVQEACSVAEARAWLRRGVPELVLLDLNLPDGDGLDLARELRRLEKPVVVVSARDSDRLACLEIGVDDFLGKPCDHRELVARVRNVWRRCGGEGGLVPLGDFCFDAERQRVLDPQGRPVALTRGEFLLLAELVQARGRVRTRDQLADALNPAGGAGSLHSVVVLVGRLRQKLEADPRSPSVLLTAPGSGYRLNL